LGLLRATVPPVHRAGLPFISAGLALALVGRIAGRNRRWLRRAGLAAAAASAGFFRHPRRVPPTRPGVVVAPADGAVCTVDTAVPPAELGLPDEALPRVGIFLSVLDAHVQRAPVGGEVLAVLHRAGRFGSADLPAASTDNERNSVRIRTPEGTEVVVVQVAGLLARRIVCDVKPGDTLAIGDTYGLIRFGSRLDTYLPAGTRPLVTVGQRAVAGETVLAELS
jgi:phosphatidylserine decarboxylase